MTGRSTHAADTRAAQAALARPPVPELIVNRVVLIDDTEEDSTRVLIVTVKHIRICQCEEEGQP